MIPNQCIEVQTSLVDGFSVPAWFAEVVILTQHLATKNLLEAFAHQVRLEPGRFGSYESIDFLARLFGYAISGERTLADFFERVASFGTADPDYYISHLDVERVFEVPYIPGAASLADEWHHFLTLYWLLSISVPVSESKLLCGKP